MLKLIPDKKNKYSLLDVGCGLGDLYNYLQFKGFYNIDYVGIDVVPEMIVGAKQKNPQVNFQEMDLFNAEIQADFVVASGTLNIVYVDWQSQEAYIRQAIKKMFELANIACGFNLLNKDCQQDFEEDPRFFYSDKVKITEFCRQLTPYCRLVEGYLPHDFTLLLRKKRRK